MSHEWIDFVAQGDPDLVVHINSWNTFALKIRGAGGEMLAIREELGHPMTALITTEAELYGEESHDDK